MPERLLHQRGRVALGEPLGHAPAPQVVASEALRDLRALGRCVEASTGSPAPGRPRGRRPFSTWCGGRPTPSGRRRSGSPRNGAASPGAAGTSLATHRDLPLFVRC